MFFVTAATVHAGTPPPPTACESNDQCDIDETCVDGACTLPDQPAPAGCIADTDCAVGQVCALSDCGPGCDPDDPACEPPDCAGAGICIDSNEPPPPECDVDSDCSGDDVCIIRTVESCSASGGSAPDGGAPAPPPSDPPTECTVETYASCGPRWFAECTVDSDCGAGFTCEFLSQTDCACTAPDADPTTDECACEETPATEGVCVLEPVACSADAECDNDFVCIVDGNVGVGCNEAGGGDCGAPESPERDAPDAVDGYCAPVGFAGPREGNEAIGGESPTTDDVENDDDDDDSDDDFGMFCAATNASPAGLLPFAALALVLRRRRR